MATKKQHPLVERVEDDPVLTKAIEKMLDEINVNSSVPTDPSDDTSHSYGVAAFVRSRFTESESARMDFESRWLKDLRQYRGQYEPEIAQRFNTNRSKAFIRLTRNKVKTVDSRLSDLLFPANGDKNWSISPTPLPEYGERQLKQLAGMYQQETKQQVSPEELLQLVQETAKKQSDKMSKIIEDQLAELRYREIMREVMHSGNLYGTGILKGPLVSISENRQYKKQSSGGKDAWVITQTDEITPFIESVMVWDIYPDMEASCIEDCRFVIQRRKMSKHDVLELGKRSDFNGKLIKRYLKEHPDGDLNKKTFEVELQSLGNVNTTGTSTPQVSSKKYEVLEYWGYVDTEDLERCGVSIPEKLKGQLEVAANIWVIGNKVIKASLVPMEGITWPFFFYYYDKDETSIFGEGIPSIMRDVQELVNSCFRAMLDNAAISAGPQIEVNMDLLSEDEDPREVYPFKVWMRGGEGPEAASPAIRVFQLPSYTMEFERMATLFKEYGNEVTAIPPYMWGDQAGGGAGRTASGLSMMMGSANVQIKDQVKNFDDGITKPFVRAMYHWNMQFGDDEDAKGDYAVVARGTSSLIAKEVFSQTLINFANITNNATDAGIVKRANIIRNIAESLDLGDKNLVYSDQEIQVNSQQQQQAQEAERQWMSQMVEVARKEGISPQDLITNLRELKQQTESEAQQQSEQQGQQENSAEVQPQQGM